MSKKYGEQVTTECLLLPI